MKKYLSFILLFVIIFVTGCNGFTATSESDVIDGITFKAEYENENNDYYYLEINKENPFKYLTSDNFESVISGTNVIFVGYSTSNVSRAIVNLINTNVSNLDINSIYYFDLFANRPLYEESSDDITLVRDGTDLYDSFVSVFDQYLDNKVVINDTEYLSSVKYVTAPVLIFIKDGKIISYYDNFGKKDDEDFIGFGEADLTKIKSDLYSLIEEFQN